jgi:hypothetical protein
MTRASDRFDTAQPHPARVYDYLLGGKDNFAADREFGERMVAAYPQARDAAWQNRAFMRRVVAWIAREGRVRQFLDVGTGLPTSPNLHEVVQQITPQSRVVYVDNDPLVLTHARALLTSSPEGATAYVDADIRDPEKILTSAAEVLDFSQPVAVTAIALLHYVPDSDDPYGSVARLMTALPSGSYLALSHGTHDPLTPDRRTRMEKLWAASPVPSQVRSRPQVERFFDGLHLIDPGVVPITDWRPDDATDQPPFADIAFYGGLALKP